MKTFLSVALFVVLALLVPFEALAGDYANFNFIGFSKNGKYLAFEQYGTADGSGFPYADIYFIDVEKNQYARPPVEVYVESETATEESVRKKAKLAAAKNLRALGIVEGNQGKLVVSRLLTELMLEDEKTTEHDSPPADQARFTKVIGSMYTEGDYTLAVNQVETKTKGCEAHGYPIYMLDVTLRDNKEQTVKTLQKDALLPASRGCVLYYNIQNIYIYEGKIAAFLNMYTVGFEGPDMRYLAVTGNL